MFFQEFEVTPSWEKSAKKKKVPSKPAPRGSVNRSLSPAPTEATVAVLNYFHNATVQGAHYLYLIKKRFFGSYKSQIMI